MSRLSRAFRRSLPIVAMVVVVPLGCNDAPADAVTQAPANPVPAPGPLAGPEATAPKTTVPVKTEPAASPAVRPIAPPSGTGAAQISFELRRHDFGNIWDMADNACSFPFTNTGGETLRILEIRPGCSCTQADVDKRVFAPGEGSAIEILFDPTSLGRQSKTVRIVTNDASMPVSELTFTATVREFVTVTPAFVLFEEVELGETHKKTFTVSATDPDLIIESVEARIRPGTAVSESAAPYISARVVSQSGPALPGAPRLARGEHLIEVTIHDNAPWGALYGVVDVTCRGRPSPSEPEVVHVAEGAVNASVYGALQASDQMIRFGVIPPGGSFQKSVRITHRDGLPFSLLSADIASSTLPGIRVKTTPIRQPGVSGYDLSLSGSLGRFGGRINGFVNVQTDIPGEERIAMRFGGVVREAGK